MERNANDLRADVEGIFLVGVVGKCGGVVLDDLEMDKKETVSQYRGVSLEQGSPDDAPVIVQNCTIQRPVSGIRVSGLGADSKTATPVSCALIVNNRLVEPSVGIVLLGMVKNAVVAGNRISGASLAAVQLEHLLPGAANILIANNTMFESNAALRYRDDLSKPERGVNVQIRNSLVLDAKRPDMVFLDTGGAVVDDKGPGDGKSLHEKWVLSHNWREIKASTAKFGKEWIPPSSNDAVLERIDVLSRHFSSADFLRPAKNSPLATAGAAGDLPSYVGAMPPEGVAPWDWQRTWNARVSKGGSKKETSKE